MAVCWDAPRLTSWPNVKAGKVLLLDANEIASQASSRAACLLTRARTKPALMEMVQETYDCIDEIEHLLGSRSNCSSAAV